jgi:Ca2+:H+ antiporter
MVLLLALPASILLEYAFHAPALAVFVTACLGVLPLAGYMGEATEHLAHRTGPTIGGLLNATFGNAAELIISIVALQAGLVSLVKASITGSILGNLLLILGLAFVAGGSRKSELRFNRTSAGMSAGMLTLAVVALVLPALFHSVHPEAAARLSELRMSEAVAVILLVTYGFSLLFSLKTHRRLLSSESPPTEGPPWGVGRATLILALATVGVAIESELLVHAVTEAGHTLGLTEAFLGLIIIPIIGNAAEHATAVVVARKGQMDLALQIALGSSTQIALLVAPLLVFCGLLLGQNMDLVFTPFEVMALGLATIVTAIITLDGESHWFEGVQLLAVYGMVAVGAFFLV